MKMIEQNISSVKLEKLRQDAMKKFKLLHRLFPILFIPFAALAVFQNRIFFTFIREYGFGEPATQGSFFGLLGGLMMAFILAGTLWCFYYILVWKKSYNLFNFSFKNRFVLNTIQQIPGFSDLRYNAQGGMSYEEVRKLNLIPEGKKAFFASNDELRGALDQVRFRACNVRTGIIGRGRSSAPEVLFEGQIIAFSLFDDRKISNGFVQVFSKKALSKVKTKAAPLQIQTENSMFNENFAVFAENEENAFYILTPRVLEQITKFKEAVEGQIYLSFVEAELYVTCQQFRNPFDAFVDIPVKEQQKRLIDDTAILRNARDILIQISECRNEA